MNTTENIETIKKIVSLLSNKETLTDNEFCVLYVYTKYLMNVISTEEIKNNENQS